MSTTKIWLVGLIVWVFVACSPQTQEVSTTSETYQKAVNDFRVSLAASQTDESRFAFNKMNDVVLAYPQEAAAWTNLGVMAMRQGNRDLSISRFERALQEQPDHPDILWLFGDAQSRFGASEKAVSYFEQAIGAFTKSTPSTDATEQVLTESLARFRYLTELERLDPVANKAQIQSEFEVLSSLESENIAFWTEWAQYAAQQNDLEVLREYTEKLTSWSFLPAQAQSFIPQLEQAISQQSTQDLGLQLSLLRSQIEPLERFQRDLARIALPVNDVGFLLPRFLALPPWTTTLSPIDDNTTLERDPYEAVHQGADAIRSVLLFESEPPFLLSLHGNELRLLNDQRLDVEVFQSVQGQNLNQSPKASTVDLSNQLQQVDLDLSFRNSLVLAGQNGFQYLRQTESMTFEDVTFDVGLPEQAIKQQFHGVWIIDFELDGDLDILVSPVGKRPQVFQNNGDGSLSWLQNPLPDAPLDVVEVHATDVDQLLDPDLVMMTADGELRVLHNQRRGVYRQTSQAALSSTVADVVTLDVNLDGDYEIIAVTEQGVMKTWSLQTWSWSADSQSFTAQTIASSEDSGQKTPTDLFKADIDNNGGVDLITSYTNESAVFMQKEDLSYSLSYTLQADIQGVFDVDGDDRIDLLGKLNSWMSLSPNPYNASSLRLRASSSTGDGRINSFGIGGAVEMVSGPLYQKRQIESPIVHLGLGDREQTDMLRILWPNGSVQTEFAELGLAATIFNEQILKGSCPWLFTHDGEDFAFVTDVLWRSPLGLRINAQETAGIIQTTDRVRIDPAQLQPREGRYDLRITAELWESHFFDHVALEAITHPKGTMVSVDERFVFPAPDLSPVLHTMPEPVEKATVKPTVEPAMDATEILKAKDNQHLQAFQKTAIQGVAKSHSITLELPAKVFSEVAAHNASEVLMIMRGWLYPTDSSLNVLLAQGDLPKPSGLTIDVWDDQRGWTTLHDDYGTPAGKDKTILLPVPLDKLDPTNPKIRLRTTSEIFWDAIQWSVPLDQDVETLTLRPLAQNLSYRGFSEWVQADTTTPLRPNYNVISGTQQRWNDLEGYHTRFGDISPLLEEIDDRYVIMTAGDEMHLSFEAPTISSSQQLTTFFVSDGWVKDGDYNTEASRTVEPYPVHDMADFDYTSLPSGTENPAFQLNPKDWEQYHTRYITPRRFQTAIVQP